MRISVDQDDAGFETYQRLGRAARVMIFLDGIALTNCTMADDALGEVERYRDDQRGAVDHFLKERLKGAVRIEIGPGTDMAQPRSDVPEPFSKHSQRER